MSDTQSTDSDDHAPSDPINRLDEVRKQADLAADKMEDASAARYARKAAACAESAQVLLEGPEILENPLEEEHEQEGDNDAA